MKAIRVRKTGGPEVLVLEERARSRPGRGPGRRADSRGRREPGRRVHPVGRAGPASPRCRTCRALDGAGVIEAVGPGVAGMRRRRSRLPERHGAAPAQRHLRRARAVHDGPGASASRAPDVRPGRRRQRPVRHGVSRDRRPRRARSPARRTRPWRQRRRRHRLDPDRPRHGHDGARHGRHGSRPGARRRAGRAPRLRPPRAGLPGATSSPRRAAAASTSSSRCSPTSTSTRTWACSRATAAWSSSATAAAWRSTPDRRWGGTRRSWG